MASADDFRGGKNLASGEAGGLATRLGAAEEGSAQVAEITDAAYTILAGDTHVWVHNTTAGDFTFTFAAGTDGQEVMVMQRTRTSGGNFIAAGTNDNKTLAAVGDYARYTYVASQTVWILLDSRNTA